MAEEIRPGARAEEQPRASRSASGTRTVRMTEPMSGGRHDGQAWPAAGGTIKVPAWEAEDLVAARVAVFEGDEPEVHSGETVPASVPPGHVATGRVARGEASAEEVMTGHPADFSAEERAAEEQHGARGDEEFRGARHGHPDPRPDSQVLAEDFTDEERQRIELGEVAAEKAESEPASLRRKDRVEGRKAEAARRAAERNSARRYAAEGGVAGAPGAEVPGLEGAEPVPFAEGVRPESQAVAEAPVRGLGEEDPVEPGLEGMPEEERIEHETRMPGYTAPEEVRTEPVPGQPTLEPVRADGAAGEQAAPEDGGEGRHRITAASDAPIEVSGEGAPGGAAPASQEDAAAEGQSGVVPASQEDAAAEAGEAGQAGDAPAPSAPKQAWVDYAVSKGADVHAASNMTKADLMSRYGGRL